MTQEQAIEKIKKLFELANNSAASEGEVQNSLKLAQQLLLKFGLSNEDLKDDKGDEVLDIAFETDTKTPSSNLLILAQTLASHYRCKLYRSRVALHILGTPLDAKTFKQVLNYSYSNFIKLAKIYISTIEGRSEKTKAKNTYLTGFCQGMKEALEYNEAQYALVPLVPQVVLDKVEDMHLGRGHAINKSGSNSFEHFNAGFHDGYESSKREEKRIA